MEIRHGIGSLCAPVIQTTWVWELLAAFLSVATIASTAISISSLKGRPLPQWPLRITPNTLLSIYAVVFKACVSFALQSCLGQLQWIWFKSHRRPLADVSLYDAAGRGAWGSAMWLYTFHIRNPLATLAALVTVISIAADPAFQQIIRFSDCLDQVVAAQTTGGPDGSLATAPRTNYVDGKQLYGRPVSNTWSQPAQSALNAGVFTPVGPLTVSCPTGNCTFDNFHTAGYCSSCQDVSTDLQFDIQCTDSDFTKLWLPAQCSSTNIKSINTAIVSSLAHINGTTSSMIWNASYEASDSNVLSGSIPSYARGQPCRFDIIMGRTYFSENGFDPLTGKPVEDVNCNQYLANTGWRCRGYGAASCRMYPCVRSYDVSVRNGVVSQVQTHHTTVDLLGTLPYWNSSHQDYGWTPRDFVIIDMKCLSPIEREGLLKEGYNLDTNPRWLAYDLVQSLNFSAPVSPDAPYPASMFAPQRQCTYVFDRDIDYRLTEFFIQSRFMLGNVQGAPMMSMAGTQIRLNTFFGSRELQTLYNSTNISFEGIQRTFDNIADSFTAYIRTTGHPSYSIPASGTALHYAVCLEANWAWITLPSLLAAGILILLPLTIILSTKKGVPIWKSSNMPLVFRGPLLNTVKQQTGKQPATVGSNTTDIVPLLHLRSPSSEKLAQTDDTLAAMENEAKETTVHLEQVHGKTRLVLVDISKG